MLETLIPEDRAKVEALPEETQRIYGAWPHAMLAIAEGQNLDPLPEGYGPKNIEVYHESPDCSVLDWSNGEILHISTDFLVESAVMIVLIDDVPRYVKTPTHESLDTIGGCELPDLVLNPLAAALALLDISN